MNANKTLIVFAEDWGRFPSSTQSLISALLKKNWHVTWINSIGLRKPSLSISYFKRVLEKLAQFVLGKKSKYRISLPENLTVIHPLIIPFIGNPIIDTLNCFILKKQLKTTLKKMKQPIIWLTLPSAYPFIRIFNNCPLVYYCCDDYSALVKPPLPKLDYFENQLIEKAALIYVTSAVLAKKMPKNKTHFLDQAIDIDLFTKPYARPDDLPTGKPIAGFYGSLCSWVDINLIYQCATRLKNWNFVFIGPKNIDLEKLETLSNFFYLGPKAYVDIPAYSQHWDVGLIPFVNNQVTAACNPLKIKEYLSAGKPVVTTNIPALHMYKKNIYIAKDTDDFINGIVASLGDNKEEIRKNLVKDQSWDSRALALEKQLLDLSSFH
ncbi:glycosyltransferase [Fluoribacter gormanii]|uniref:Glycosyltransferase involved in cell wall bisynthesis n=1 Tax=Fluoribacter gormanii TaxID=464 RepID=A0A377GN69_9GAMM|nr:glycosyltransferase [Fluoribacter gormanii]KTD04754.1 putative teichuronic acid biosynthesis glycosyltransferase TuaH [Fluoribacter gormanii]SIR15593.1 Glycosyltransferase involved in cell wall bisynthesis [Fluoribacter gormanii]STO26246.1 Uncharacterised protein [Fluoribacter gormanii]